VAVKLHRCPATFNKLPAHPCWKVQKALNEAGIEYEVVKEPALRFNRKDYERRSGTRLLPAIEFEDGTIVREESAALAARIRDGRLDGLRPDQGGAV
jgi:glutathione S-transferase